MCVHRILLRRDPTRYVDRKCFFMSAAIYNITQYYERADTISMCACSSDIGYKPCLCSLYYIITLSIQPATQCMRNVKNTRIVIKKKRHTNGIDIKIEALLNKTGTIFVSAIFSTVIQLFYLCRNLYKRKTFFQYLNKVIK